MKTKKTPLYDEHIKQGGKIVDYAGWLLPIQYEGLVAEHNSVRNQAGLFDVTHMGEIMVRGKESLSFLNYLLTNNISNLEDNQTMYAFMCQPDGGVVDDLLVYKYNEEEFLLVVNASNADKDYEWIKDKKGNFDVEIENISERIGQVALQGPLSEEILQKLTKTDLSQIKAFYLKRDVDINGVNAMISRTGYTGEDGFEIYTDKDDIVKVWNDILDAGEKEGVKPAGLGSRDTLRFEASLPLYGNELSKDINPLEAGLKFFVKLDKESDFIGKESLTRQWEEGLKRKIVGFEMIDRGIPREGYEIYKDGKKIGHVTTGYMSPSLNKSIGNALIQIEDASIGNEVDIKVRKKTVKAKIISKRFLKKK